MKAIAATAEAVSEAHKLTLEHPMHVYCPHSVQTLLQQRGQKWLTDAQLTHYESLLLGPSDLTFEACNRLNPATLLPLPEGAPEDGEAEGLHYDCLEVTDFLTVSRLDLKDTPLENPDKEFFVDGSSRVVDGKRHTG